MKNRTIWVGALILLVITIMLISFYSLGEKEEQIEKGYCETDTDCVWAFRLNS